MELKDLYALTIACVLFGILSFGQISLSLHFWTEDNYEILGIIALVLFPLFVTICGFIAVRLSAVRRWWFSLLFAAAAYALLVLASVSTGTEPNFGNWGLAALRTPLIMLVFSGFGGGIYHFVAAKH